MLKLLLLVAAATASPATDRLAEAEHAIAVGRLDQARSMISDAIANGAKGEAVDRLLADFAYAADNSAEALARYNALAGLHPDDALLLERAAISAIKTGDLELAKRLTDQATSLPHASWRAWNARGVAADLQRDFETAEESYSRALTLAPETGELLNNLGWSRLLRGDWNVALEPLEMAARHLPGSERVANNLELARVGMAVDLPRRRPNEPDETWAARLNDAGVAAALRGDRAKAVAAFAQAIEARPSWYARAANNLELFGAGK